MRKKILLMSIFSIFISKNIFADKNEQILSQGKNVYTSNCLMCHGNSGLGDGPVGQNLTIDKKNPNKKIAPFKTFSEKQIIEILSGKKIEYMPDFKTSLSADQKQAVAKYIVESLSQKK